MTVYADILILTNLIVDYFLLLVTAKITRQKPPLWRTVAASFTAAATTLVIFLPEQNRFLDFFLRLILSFAVCFIGFGYKSLRRFISCSLVFFAVSFCYGGAMMALLYIFKPSGMTIKNSVVYFDISPLFLIGFSVAGFLISSIFSSLFARRHKDAEHCYLTLTFCGRQADFSALIDTGNSLSEPFGSGAVIVADSEKCRLAFGELTPETYPKKYRAIPCGTVLGNSVLNGFRCDKAKVITTKKTVELKNPVLALSASPLCDCEALINPADID
ncbi:MAG: sigma-E processing peptidase SpoIIGA [Clostridia bacterium]|nr:sigma-E processing peptidase SpoIIGA [Clostridia bacterium]